eukprot:TRINITY_DN2626_c0_g1_i2.p1 TRINITY_DN2626_c0_g1~~TRINITY_DN2626_c0_g1_i2.p1  ORF type:complete len:643 (+),score=130.21 TRINITY_DN2626_c0_g1_i2:127-2055(+)
MGDLMTVVNARDPDVTQTLINLPDTDVNAPTPGGETALMCAARIGSLECLEVVIDGGANLNLRDKEGKTALFHAAENGHTPCVGVTPLHIASVNAFPEVVAVLLRYNANPVACDNQNQTPILSVHARLNSPGTHASVCVSLLRVWTMLAECAPDAALKIADTEKKMYDLVLLPRLRAQNASDIAEILQGVVAVEVSVLHSRLNAWLHTLNTQIDMCVEEGSVVQGIDSIKLCHSEIERLKRECNECFSSTQTRLSPIFREENISAPSAAAGALSLSSDFELIGNLSAAFGKPCHVRWSESGVLAVATVGGVVILSDVVSAPRTLALLSLPDHPHSHGVEWANSSSGCVVSLCSSNTLAVWDVDTMTCLRTVTVPHTTTGQNILSFAFHPTNPSVVAVASGNVIHFCSTSTGRRNECVCDSLGNITAFKFRNDGLFAVAGDHRGSVALVGTEDTARGVVKSRLVSGKGEYGICELGFVCVTPSLSLLAVISLDNTFRLYRCTPGSLIKTELSVNLIFSSPVIANKHYPRLPPKHGGVGLAFVSANVSQAQIVCGSETGLLHVFTVNVAESVHSTSNSPSPALPPSAESTPLQSGSAELTAHTRGVVDVAYSPAGGLASLDAEGTVLLWRRKAGPAQTVPPLRV